jgi:phosphonate transport system substrate-binding protein
MRFSNVWKPIVILSITLGVVLTMMNLVGPANVRAQRTKIRFGVGPLQPTRGATKSAFEPFFAWLAKELDVDYELTATDSWAGISVALLSDQVDVAWMGPWGYVLANDASDILTGKPITAIATVKYDEKPIYYAIIVGQPGLSLMPLIMEDKPGEAEIKAWLEAAKQYSISFADVGSTSGFLIPTAFFRSYNVDPTKYFAKYSVGATHAANETAVVNGQADLATDFDRNRNTMIENGAFKAEQSMIYWKSNPLPNDAIAVRPGLDQGFVEKLHKLLLGVTPDKAKELQIGTGGTDRPVHYTGFVAATDVSYVSIRKAGIFIGKVGARERDHAPAESAAMTATMAATRQP